MQWIFHTFIKKDLFFLFFYINFNFQLASTTFTEWLRKHVSFLVVFKFSSCHRTQVRAFQNFLSQNLQKFWNLWVRERKIQVRDEGKRSLIMRLDNCCTRFRSYLQSLFCSLWIIKIFRGKKININLCLKTFSLSFYL